METLKRIREPLAWAMVVLAALWLAYQIANQVTTQLYVLDPEDGHTVTVVVTWALVSINRVELSLLLGLVLAAVGCAATPATPRSRAIALAAAWVATLSVALPWLVGLGSAVQWRPEDVTVVSGWDVTSPLDFVVPLLETAVGVVAAIALWALARRPSDDEPDEGDGIAIEADPAHDPAPPDPATVWRPSEATGTVWRTADEAAAGVPGIHATGSGAEWAEHAVAPEAAPADDWRPPRAE